MTVAAEQIAAAYAAVRGGPGPDDLVGSPIAIPEEIHALDPDGAYALQADVMSRVSAVYASTFRGFKVSATNPADRATIGLSEPTFGRLLDEHLVPDGAEIPLDESNGPLVEAELAFRVERQVDPGMSIGDAAACLSVAPALEIPVSRFADWFPAGGAPRVDIPAFIADNSAAGFVAVGGSWRPAADTDFAAVSVTLTADEVPLVEGHATIVDGHPVNSVLWLAGRLERLGETLPVGAIISSGTLIKPQRPRAGLYRADFGQEIGSVAVRFA